MGETTKSGNGREKVWSLIEDVKVALFVTHAENGELHSRPMAAIGRELEHDELWFASRENTSKLSEIADDSHVLLAYSEPKGQNYVSVSGRATVVRDQAKVEKFWTEDMRVWFPNGPRDTSIILIRVDVEGAEYWDAPSSVWIHAVGYVKARLTGNSPQNVGDHKVVAL